MTPRNAAPRPAPPERHNGAVFSCPHCARPGAMTVEPELDIHSGAAYTCDECAGKVVFVAMSPDEYVRHCNAERSSRNL